MGDLIPRSQEELDELEYQNWVPKLKQKNVVDLAQSVFPRMTIATLCRRAKIDPSTFHKWIKHDKCFARFWGTLHQSIAKNHMAGCVAALVRKAESGDVPAIRLMAELAGALGPNRVEISGPDGKPLQTMNAHLVALSTEALVKIRDLLKEVVQESEK